MPEAAGTIVASPAASPPAVHRQSPAAEKPLHTRKGGPADEFKRYQVDLKQTGSASSVSLHRVRFAPDNDQQSSWDLALPVDDPEGVMFSTVTTDDTEWGGELVTPGGDKKALQRNNQNAGGAPNEPVHSRQKLFPDMPKDGDHFFVKTPTPGQWKVHLTRKGGVTPTAGGDGWLVVQYGSPNKAFSYRTTEQTGPNKPVGVAAFLFRDSPAVANSAERANPGSGDPEKIGLAGLKDDTSKPIVPAGAIRDSSGGDKPNVLPPVPALPVNPDRNAVKFATITVMDAQQSEQSFEMKDDGLSNDEKAGDGLYGALMSGLKAGIYTYRVDIQAATPSGLNYQRTSVGNFYVLATEAELASYATAEDPVPTGDAVVDGINQPRIQFLLGANMKTGPIPAQARVYAEVWGQDVGRKEKPIGWIGGIVDTIPQAGSSAFSVPVTFHLDWLGYAEAQGPFVLRNVRLMDLETNLFFAQRREVAVQLAASAETKISQRKVAGKGRSVVTEEMRSGLDPQSSGARRAVSGITNYQVDRDRNPILLVHGMGDTPGYFDINSPDMEHPWPVRDFGSSGDGTSGHSRVFFDPAVTGQCVSNRVFAWALDRFAKTQSNTDSFSAVGHSQGGMAALTWADDYAYSKIRYSKAARIIQAENTPWLGSVNTALNNFFNIGPCPAPYDLTRDGAYQWWLSISVNWESKVYYARTAHNEWSFLNYDFCSPASYGIISGDDDGVLGLDEQVLPYGKDTGIRRALCHVPGMNYGSVTQDHGFNAKMYRYAFKSYDVGVIPDGASCGAGMDMVQVYMDDEDNRNANWSEAWTGATGVGNNTTWRFCRVRNGSLFKPLLGTLGGTRIYAVLKLGTHCPPGSGEFQRYFDNEDNNNANWSSGDIFPNESNRNTRLSFCTFRDDPGTGSMSSFPDLGQSYGVFAPDNFVMRQDYGRRYIDDQDDGNANSYWKDPYSSLYLSEFNLIVSGTNNTQVNLVKVK